MGRWRRHLDPSVKKDAWGGSEDEKLMRLHDTLGPRWSNISKMLTGRTAQQCRARWFQLSAVEDDGTDLTNGSDFTDGTTVVTVTMGNGGASQQIKKRGKSLSENMSPSTPSVTDEAGTVSTHHGVNGVVSASSKKRVGQAGDNKEKVKKQRKTPKDFKQVSGSGEGDGTNSPDYYGHGSGLDMLAMLYSAAVTYEQGMTVASGGVKAASAGVQQQQQPEPTQA